VENPVHFRELHATILLRSATNGFRSKPTDARNGSPAWPGAPSRSRACC